MNQQSQAKIWRRTVLGAVAVAWGTFGSIETPPAAAAEESLILAQVRVQRDAAPANLIKLHSRTHTPLPTREAIPDYDYYGNPVYHSSRRGRRRFRSFRRRSRFGRHGRFDRYGRFGRRGRDRFDYNRRSRFRRRFRRRRGSGNLIIKKRF